MKQQPDAKAFQKMASRLKENSRQWDALNLQLDQLIAKVEEDISRNSLGQKRLRKEQMGESEG